MVQLIDLTNYQVSDAAVLPLGIYQVIKTSRNDYCIGMIGSVSFGKLNTEKKLVIDQSESYLSGTVVNSVAEYKKDWILATCGSTVVQINRMSRVEVKIIQLPHGLSNSRNLRVIMCAN